jgi:hypothetical protein
MFDITKKRALETADIELVTGDGAPLYDDEGNVLSVTVHGPGSKIWQQADAERNRRRTARIEKNRGKISAALDHAREDEVDFLCSITVSFNGWEYPPTDGKAWPTKGEMFRAAYADDTIGYIRDHVHKEANDWSVFTRGSATS